MGKGGIMQATKKVVDAYNGLYDTKNFPVCFVLWMLGLTVALQGFENPYDGLPHPFSTFMKSVYVSLPVITIMLPGLIELMWLPKDQHKQWAKACQKCFVAGCWNLLPSGFVMYKLHGEGGMTVLSQDPHGWVDVGHFFLLLASHEFWFYVMHRMNHLEFIFSTTHGHHHKNKGLVFMVNNSDVDVWELCSQGLFGLVFPLLFMEIRSLPHLLALGFFFVNSCSFHSSAMRPGALHVVHHQYGRHATNFGLYTPLMDTLFGTYEKVYNPENAEKLINAAYAKAKATKAN